MIIKKATKGANCAVEKKEEGEQNDQYGRNATEKRMTWFERVST